jgi:hypothetical protein
MIESWDAGAYRDVREIWEQAAIQAGDDKFRRELVRGLNALTGHLEYDIGQIRSALSILSELSSLMERGKQKTSLAPAASAKKTATQTAKVRAGSVTGKPNRMSSARYSKGARTQLGTVAPTRCGAPSKTNIHVPSVR